MVKFLKSMVAGLALVGAASVAYAAPITFTYSEPDSSLDLSGLEVCLTCADISLAPSQTFTLNNIGDSFTFDFININIDTRGGGALGGFITGNLVFTAPGSGGAGTGVAAGGGFWALGFGAGGLTWLDQPDNIVFSDGTEISLNFSDAGDSCIFLVDRGCHGSLTATVEATTELVARVPEPATLALLGMGLFGVGLARRRSKLAA